MNENKRIAINSIFVFLKLCISSIVGIIASRLVLEKLGIEDYGVYNVVGGIVVLLNVVNTAMITTSYRYIAYEIGKKEHDYLNINAVFNRCHFFHIVLAVLIIVLSESIGIFYIDNYMNIANYKIQDAHFVLHMSTITAFFTAISVPYQGLLTAYERFSYITYTSILTEIYRFVAILCLMNYTGNALRMFSIIMIGISLIPFILYSLYSRIKFINIIRWNFQTEWVYYKEMCIFSFWVLFGALSSIAKTQGAQILVNFFYGTALNAAYAIASQVNNALLMFSNNFSVAVNPQITKSYSGGDNERAIDLTCFISRISTFILMIFSLPFFIETDLIFNLWLEEVPQYSTLFCKLMIIHALIGTLCAGMPALTQASGKIKVFQLLGSSLSLSSLLFAFVAYKLGSPPETIVIIYCFISAIIVFINLYLLKRILNIDIDIFINKAYKRILFVIVPLSIYIIGYLQIQLYGWFSFIGLFISEIILVLLIFFCGMNKHERVLFSNKLKLYYNKLRICKQ